MPIAKPEDFYATYAEYKSYVRPELKAKHVKWLDREFWVPARCEPHHSVLEIGCGTGQFLLYLHRKGVTRFTGIDQDAKIKDVLPPEVAAHVRIADVWEFLKTETTRFDRIVMLDVLEHFTIPDGAALLEAVRGILAPDGMLTVRVPNMASPWAGQHQYADLTHKAAYAPGGLRQLAIAAGFDCVAFVDQRRGSRSRRFLEDCLHGLFAAVLTETPPLWSANMIAILKPRAARA